MAGVFVLQNSTPAGIISQLNFIDNHGLSDELPHQPGKEHLCGNAGKSIAMAKDHFKYEDMTLVLVGDKKLLEKADEIV